MLAPKTFDNRKRKVLNGLDGRNKRNGSVGPFRTTFVSARSSVALPLVGATTNQALAIPSDKSTGLHAPANSFREHVLSLWEDKFRLRCLAVEDVLFLLTHSNVASTLESASFLRGVDLTYDQVMELEMALVMLRRQEEWVKAHSPKAPPTSLCDKLARNTWIRSRALPIVHTNSAMLPEVIVCKRVPARAKLPQKQTRIPIKPHNVLAAPKSSATPKLEACPLEIREWVRDHCMEEVTRSMATRKQFAVEKLSVRTTLSLICNSSLLQTYIYCSLMFRSSCPDIATKPSAGGLLTGASKRRGYNATSRSAGFAACAFTANL